MAARKGAEDTSSAPSAAEIRAALSEVLDSNIFERSARAGEFLRFVVEETLAGRGERLKGYVIALEVFGRDADFDPQRDPLVRVEARRLRQRLLEYYSGPGAADLVRIEFRRRQYAPQFSWSAAAAGERPDETRAPNWKWPTAAGIALAALMVTASFLVRPGTDGEPKQAAALLTAGEESPNATDPRSGLSNPSSAAGREDNAGPGAVANDEARGARLPRVVVLPVRGLSDDPRIASLAAGLTDELNVALVAFDIVTVASPAGSSFDPASLDELRDEFNAGFVLTGSVRTDGSDIRFAFRLIETGSGTQLWSDAFDYDAAAAVTNDLETSLALRIAMLMSSPYGPVFGHEIELIRSVPVTDLDPFGCMLRFYGYGRTFDPRDHADSVTCMQRAVLSAPESATAWAALAVLYLHEFTFGYDPQPDRGPPLDRALDAVRRALAIDSTGRVAVITLPSILLARGDKDAFLQESESALEVRPNHPAVRAQIGYILTLSGNWQRGVPLIEQALPVTAEVPGWYYTAFAYRYLQTEDYGQALEWSRKIESPTWFAAPMTVAACAALAGSQDLALREAARLLELYPNFEQEGAARLEAMSINPELRERLIFGLALAGIDLK